ncbi:MAG: hypothetical protein KAG66_00505 [Methylococcales bacterium]|nr:hypothetical protein [Methylococcales bacterium]
MRLAKIENSTITNIVVSDVLIDGYVEVYNKEAIGDVLEANGDFSRPEVVDENPMVTMTITAPQERVSPGSIVTITVTVAAPVNAEYLVPIMRLADKKQTDLISVTLVDGEADFQVVFNEKGVYTLPVDQIIPVPTAILENEFRIVVV